LPIRARDSGSLSGLTAPDLMRLKKELMARVQCAAGKGGGADNGGLMRQDFRRRGHGCGNVSG
jgi:hypothetical protein